MPTKPWDLFGTDREIETTGVWLDYGDFKIKIASTGSEKYKRTMKAVFKPYERQVQTGTMPEELAEEKLTLVFARAIVLDWWCSEWGEHTMWDKEGNRLDYNEQNVIKLLTEMPKLQDMIRDEAQRAENFRKREEEDALKNSSRSLSTTSEPASTPKPSSMPRAKEA